MLKISGSLSEIKSLRAVVTSLASKKPRGKLLTSPILGSSVPVLLMSSVSFLLLEPLGVF